MRNVYSSALLFVMIGLVSPVLGQTSVPPIRLMKRLDYVQVDPTTLSVRAAALVVFTKRPSDPSTGAPSSATAPTTFTVHLEAGGSTYTFAASIPPTANPFVEIQVGMVSFPTTAELERAFPTNGPVKIKKTWTTGLHETWELLPGVPPARLAPVTNFAALQDWDGGPLSINWSLPAELSPNAYLYRASSINFPSDTPLVDARAGTQTGVVFSGIQAAPGETLYVEIRDRNYVLTIPAGSSPVMSPIGSIRFPVRRAQLGPTIVTQPVAQVARAGGTVKFSVTAAGTEVTYQWHKNDSPIPGATAAVLELASVGLADEARYTVVVANRAGQVTSTPAALTLARPPTFATAPQAQTTLVGSEVTLSVAVVGTPPFSYQWLRDGEPIPDATASTLTLRSARLHESGRYAIRVTNLAGTLTSEAAELTIIPITRISNLSIRSQVGGGAGSLLVGFTVGGAGATGEKPLLLRAVGPTLSSFGVSDALPDPRLVLLTGATTVAQNDDWAGDAAIVATSATVGAFALAGAASRDAAILQVMGPGGYTAQLSANAAGSGTALAELYDGSPADTFLATTLRLTNVSAISTVGAGGGVLIAGFSITGAGPKTVLARAIGPSLSQFGVTGALDDPKLELFASGAATPLATSDNWGAASNATQVGDAAASVGAFPLAADARDAALLLALPPGTYSAHVTGVGARTGTALIEIYEVP